MRPTHVVVDTTTGQVYWQDQCAEFFTEESAKDMADRLADAAWRNQGCVRDAEKDTDRYVVFRLVRLTHPMQGWWEG